VLDRKTGDMTELIVTCFLFFLHFFSNSIKEPPGRIALKEKETLENLSKQLLQSPKLEGIALCGKLSQK
jgi:hypothetical protein